MAQNNWKLFGFEIKRAGQEDNQPQQNTASFALPSNDDGAVTIQTGGFFGSYVDLEGTIRNEVELVTRYREMATQPEIESAIDNIVNETIVTSDSGNSVRIITDDMVAPENIKKKIQDEFKYILKMLDFGNMGHDIFRRWYIDGRIFYHIMIDVNNASQGIKEIRYIDPRRIRKVREIQKTKDPNSGIDIIKNVQEYYLYNERGVIGAHSNLGAKIAVDSIVNVNSGLMDSRRAMVLSYLHKAIKPLNMLRMVEDATVIYRISRAPERRVFYIDVGTLPKNKAEQYLKDIMTKYRNKLVYNSDTGEIQNDRKHLSMLEDFFLPRREGSKGTEIDTLQGGQNLGEMEDVIYFQKKLYLSLSVPVSRLQPDQGFSLGRSAEITRDELNFHKFIQRLRNKFSTVFDELLRIQLSLKGVCTEQEWMDFREEIWFDYLKDNNFEEMKDSELMLNRLSILQLIEPFVGKWYSPEYVQKNVLRLSDDQIEEMRKQNERAMKEGSNLLPPSPEEQAAIEALSKGVGLEPPEDKDDGKDDDTEAEASPDKPKTKTLDQGLDGLTKKNPFYNKDDKSNNVNNKVKSMKVEKKGTLNTIKSLRSKKK